MTPRRLLCSIARFAPLFALSLTVPHAAFGQPDASGPADLAPEARARLAQAAGDARLAPWQSDFMLELARTGATAASDPPVADLPTTYGTAAVDGAWTKLASPSARIASSAVYDSARDRMVVVGGWDGDDLNDVWAFSLEGPPIWTQLTPAGTPPSPRVFPSAIYDPVRDRIVIFGGNDHVGWGLRNDVWALSLGGAPAWTELTPTGTPPSERNGHGAIYDPVRDRMVVFGGYDISSSYLNDVWALSLDGTPAWSQLTPQGTPPCRRVEANVMYDPVRDRMLVFGGAYLSCLNDVWVLSLAGVPAWTELAPTGTPPTAGEGQRAIYDPVRDRIVVFGGYGDSYPYFDDVWALSLADSPAWMQLAPSGTPVTGRWTHSMIYDPVRDRMMVFGGEDTSFCLCNDVWALSLAGTPAWTQLTPTDHPPSERWSQSAIYDPVRDRMVVFAGFADLTYNGLNDVWALSFAGAPAWTEVSPTGTPPTARGGQGAIYDPVRDRMVAFGGWYYNYYTGFVYLNDVWALSLTGAPTWTEPSPAGGSRPIARSCPSAIYDPLRDRMVVFGGYSSGGRLNDVWALSLSGTLAWTRLMPTGTPPSARDVHSAIYDPLRDRMVVFGGASGPSSLLNDVWALSLSGTPAWAQLTPTGAPPTSRFAHSAIYDPLRDRMVVFGGASGSSSYLNDVWALSLSGTPAWSPLVPSGDPPGTRCYHSAIYDPARNRMVMFGGFWGSSTCFNDVWALEWGGTTAVDDPHARRFVGRLGPPAPNPARGTTAVSYTLAQAGRVHLGVYDVSGRLVRRLVDGDRSAGTETVVWNGTDTSGERLGAGVYFVRLAGPGFRETRKVLLLR